MRPLVEVIRMQSYGDDGTFGVVRINGEMMCLSLEPPWRSNQVDMSCIPEGQYVARRYESDKFGYETFQLIDVPYRIGIEFHVGNTVDDTGGCILLGSYLARFGSRKGIARSQRAFDHFMTVLGTTAKILVDVKRFLG